MDGRMSRNPKNRLVKTIEFVDKHLARGSRILDLGVRNEPGERLAEAGFRVENTQGEDLDVDFGKYHAESYDCVTAFEIFEHLMAPYNILKTIRAPYLIASVPLNLWFAKAYWNKKDPWDRHYHEFEQRQFDMLLERTGWRVMDRERWKSYEPVPKGIRPLLRRLVDRYYIVYCENTDPENDRTRS